MTKRLTQPECQHLYNVEGLTFTEIGKRFNVTRQAAQSIYNYRYIPADQKRKPGPKTSGGN